MTPPVAFSIAGSDSSGGAGIQADLKTFAAHGVYGVSAVTAVVAEAPGSVDRVQPVDSGMLQNQLERIRSSFPIHAIKCGMLATSENVNVISDFARSMPGIPLVVDPVLKSSSGTDLLDFDGVSILRTDLLPLATLVTPNLPETEQLLGIPLPDSDAVASAPRRLFETFGCQALVKGGHFRGSERIIDHAWIDGSAYEFPHPRLEVPDVHGTGCTLSSAIAARLALAQSLPSSIEAAIDYLTRCLENHFSWPESGGSESLNHFPDAVD